MMLIPAIDLRDGRVVRLRKGNFHAETTYSPGAEDLLRRYAALGAGWLHVIDLDGAREGVGGNRATIVGLAAQHAARLQVGGGVRSAAVIDELLDAGVARVIVGSAAIESPEAVQQWLSRYGAERVMVAFDVRSPGGGPPEVVTHGWTRSSGLSLWSAIERLNGAPLTHVLCTDVDRDGMLGGPNFDLYAEAVRRYPRLQWQASGGVRHAADLAALARLDVATAVCGRALLEDSFKPEELRPFLPGASSPASTSATAAS
jgi:phosphoribosylformimino-5-aminoimidazole carboxamide ribotide isomerase